MGSEMCIRDSRDAVEFLNYLRSLSPEHQNCPIIRLVFLDVLPPAAKHAMAGIVDMDAMAKKAQEVLRLDPSSASETPATSSPSVSAISGASLRRSSRSPGRSVGPQRSRERWRSPRRSDSPAPDLCALHFKYGGEANKCLSPGVCKWDKLTGRSGSSPVSFPGNAKAGRQ